MFLGTLCSFFSVYTPIIYTLPKKAKNLPKTLFAAKLNKLRLPPKLTDENEETDAELVNETKQIQQVHPIKDNNEQQKGKKKHNMLNTRF